MTDRVLGEGGEYILKGFEDATRHILDHKPTTQLYQGHLGTRFIWQGPDQDLEATWVEGQTGRGEPPINVYGPLGKKAGWNLGPLPDNIQYPQHTRDTSGDIDFMGLTHYNPEGERANTDISRPIIKLPPKPTPGGVLGRATFGTIHGNYDPPPHFKPPPQISTNPEVIQGLTELEDGINKLSIHDPYSQAVEDTQDEAKMEEEAHMGML